MNVCRRLLLAFAMTSSTAAAEPMPTVIVDIHALGADRLQALKNEPGTLGSRIWQRAAALGVDPTQLAEWSKKPRVRDGLACWRRKKSGFAIMCATRLCSQPWAWWVVTSCCASPPA